MKLILMRHGQSVANFENYWTGWLDKPLTDLGRAQALDAGQRLKKNNIAVDYCVTSFLQRSIVSANLVLEGLDQLYVPVEHTWRFNERHYGALVGVNKDEMKLKFGAAQVQRWRRGYTEQLPPGKNDYLDRRYDVLDERHLPVAESLEQTEKRMLPFYEDHIVPQLKDGKNVLVVAHGNSLRGLIRYLENIDGAHVDEILIPNATPIIYDLDNTLAITNKTLLMATTPSQEKE